MFARNAVLLPPPVSPHGYQLEGGTHYACRRRKRARLRTAVHESYLHYASIIIVTVAVTRAILCNYSVYLVQLCMGYVLMAAAVTGCCWRITITAYTTECNQYHNMWFIYCSVSIGILLSLILGWVSVQLCCLNKVACMPSTIIIYI